MSTFEDLDRTLAELQEILYRSPIGLSGDWIVELSKKIIDARQMVTRMEEAASCLERKK